MPHSHRNKQNSRVRGEGIKLGHTDNIASAREHSKRLLFALSCSLAVFAIEVVGAVLTRSLALLVDTAHLLTDIGMLTASTITAVLALQKPTSQRTWGWARLEVLTSLLGSLLLCTVGVFTLVEAVIRLKDDTGNQVQSPKYLLIFGLIGLGANLISILVLFAQRQDNLNMKAAFLEVLNDALGSVAVVLSALVMLSTGWELFDAVCGGFIALLMVPRAISLFISSAKILLEETPSELDIDQVRQHLREVPGVKAIHDLHASTVATGMPQLSAHITVRAGATMQESMEMLAKMQDCLRQHFPVSIEHTTFQIEPEHYREKHAEFLNL